MASGVGKALRRSGIQEQARKRFQEGTVNADRSGRRSLRNASGFGDV